MNSAIPRSSVLPALFAAIVLATGGGPLTAETDTPVPELLYNEDFNRGTNLNSWFIFGGGDGFTYRGDIIAFAGNDGTNALVFSGNAENYRNYWFGGIGRANLIRSPWTSLDKLSVRFDLGSLGDDKSRRVAFRLVQGDPAKPSWSSKWVLEVSRTLKTHTLALDTGEQTGAFDREQPITLHAITFGHVHFGAAPDVQIVIDNIQAYGSDRTPPPR